MTVADSMPLPPSPLPAMFVPLTEDAAARHADAVRWDENGLVCAVTQDVRDGQVLMVAWMNRTALIETLTSGRVCYWSRSRQSLWRKGETSGQHQRLVAMDLDCDGDCLLLSVQQTGVACHTGRRSCFYRRANGVDWRITQEPLIAPDQLYAPKF